MYEEFAESERSSIEGSLDFYRGETRHEAVGLVLDVYLLAGLTGITAVTAFEAIRLQNMPLTLVALGAYACARRQWRNCNDDISTLRDLNMRVKNYENELNAPGDN